MHTKIYFLEFFRMDIADQNACFKALLPPPEGDGELVFDDKKLYPPPKVVFIASLVSLMAYSKFFSLGNRKYTAEDRSGEKSAFLGPESRRRPTKCALRRRCGQQIWSIFANFFTRPSFSCRKIKMLLTEPGGHGQDSSKLPRHVSQSGGGNSSGEILETFGFLQIQVALIPQFFFWP